MTVIPTDTPDTLTDPDLIVVPGSANPLPVLGDQALIDWLAAAAPQCEWTASVCTGASLYAAGGLLEGKKTTTHWAFRDVVRAYGVEVLAERVVWEGNHISAAGVSAGIDMALTLTERVHGPDLAEALQLIIEYDPQPPRDSGALEKADPATKRLAMKVLMVRAGYSRVKVAALMGRTIMRARLGRARRALTRQRARQRRRPPHLVEEREGERGQSRPTGRLAPGLPISRAATRTGRRSSPIR